MSWQSDKYRGIRPCSILYMNVASLKSTRRRTGGTGVMCSRTPNCPCDQSPLNLRGASHQACRLILGMGSAVVHEWTSRTKCNFQGPGLKLVIDLVKSIFQFLRVFDLYLRERNIAKIAQMYFPLYLCRTPCWTIITPSPQFVHTNATVSVCRVLPARRYSSAVFAVERCLSVRLSVCPSHDGII